MFDSRMKRRILYCGALILFCAGYFVVGKWKEMKRTEEALSTKENKPEAIMTAQILSKNRYEDLYPDMYVEESEKPEQKEHTEGERFAYLTFDDGPSERTEEVLKALDEVEAKATFFLIGAEITPEREELVKKMAQEGHILGVHTYSHESKDVYHSVESYLEDFHKTYKRIYEVTGVKPIYFRFPWGSVNCYSKNIRSELIEEMERRGFIFFDWNVSAEDSVGKPTEASIKKNVSYFTKFKEAVILMHDGMVNKKTAEVLPDILASIKKEGYTFATVDQMSKPYQYPR